MLPAGTGEAVAADREVAQGGRDRGPLPVWIWGQVLAEGDVADPSLHFR
jgi:hypothetical protein